MPKARSPNRDKAKELWLESNKKRSLKNIAAELGVSEEQVRKWKCQDDWENKRKVTLPKGKKDTKSNVTKRPRGAPKGNKNAVGSHPGAPPGSQNHLKHGFFVSSYSDEERDMIEKRDELSEEQHLLNEITLLEIREKRIMDRIMEQESSTAGLVIRSASKKGNETATQFVATSENVKEWEALLIQVQRTRLRCITKLDDIRLKRKQAEFTSGQDLANVIMQAYAHRRGEKD